MDTAFSKQEEMIEKVGILTLSYPILQISNVHFQLSHITNLKCPFSVIPHYKSQMSIFSYPTLQISNVHFPVKEKNTKNRGTIGKKFEISYL